MDELTELAVKYGADKAPQIGRHSYTPYYFELLSNRKNEIKKVLEIGVGKGNSLRMWRDFFPNATIFGIDYVRELMFTEDRIQTFLYDQRKTNHLASLIQQIGSDLDLVIDDGSHRPEVQIYTCTKLMPMLTNRDLIYIIEDVYSSAVSQTLANYGYEVRDPEINYINRFDNKLVVVKPNKAPNISIFAKPAFRDRGRPSLKRVSSIIRGNQIAEAIGAKLNPTENYQGGICIYVKPPHKIGQDFLFEGKQAYLDIVDDLSFVEVLRKHPEVNVISISNWNEKVLKQLLPNKIINIPQHHANFERQVKRSSDITRIGIIGNTKAFDYLPSSMEESIKKRGIEFIKYSNFSERADIVNFYMNIDLQVMWRPYLNYRKNILANPLKIVNASSFGVPTIAYAEPGLLEMEGAYIPVTSLEEFLEELDKLRVDHTLYEKYSKRGLELAENYHIDKIKGLYKRLPT